MQTNSATNWTMACVTITAGSMGIAPGTARASGNTTSDSRLADEKGTARPAARHDEADERGEENSGEVDPDLLTFQNILHAAPFRTTPCTD